MAADLVCQIDKHFAEITDPRVNRGANHDLVEMIFMALTATLCGAQGWVDVERFVRAKRVWFERFIPLEQGVPSHDTFGRVFARLDTTEFLTAMCPIHGASRFQRVLPRASSATLQFCMRSAVAIDSCAAQEP